MAPTITIPKRLTNGEELIVIRRREYEELHKHLAEVKNALFKIQQGENELRHHKTRVVKSLEELRR